MKVKQFIILVVVWKIFMIPSIIPRIPAPSLTNMQHHITIPDIEEQTIAQMDSQQQKLIVGSPSPPQAIPTPPRSR